MVESLVGEVWRPVPGFEGKYEISSLKRVKSLKRESAAMSVDYTDVYRGNVRRWTYRVREDRILGSRSGAVKLFKNGGSMFAKVDDLHKAAFPEVYADGRGREAADQAGVEEKTRVV